MSRNTARDARLPLLTNGPTSTTAVTVPTSPFGFEAYCHFEPNEPLNVLAIYLSAIDCMYQFAQKGWHDSLDGGFRTWAQGFKVEVETESSQGSGGPLPLLTSHIVLGLYYTIVEISRANSFCKVTTTLSIQNRQRGLIRIHERALGMPSNGLTDATTKHLSSTTPAYPSGRATDADDPRFTIDYAYDGARIASQEIFIAILDGLATSAQYADDARFQHLTATSASGKCAIDISAVAGPHQTNYSFVTKALRLLTWDVILRLRKFGGMTFELRWEGTSIARGYMRVVGSVPNDAPPGIEVARREADASPRLPKS